MAKRIALGFVIGFWLLVVLDAILARAGLVPGAIPRLAGTAAWTTSRAAGVTAFVALTLDIAFGLFISTRVADRLISRALSVEAHRWLSGATLMMIALHALVLVLDRFVRFDVLDAMLPFLSGYRPLGVGLGVLGAYGAVVLHGSFWLRRRIGGTTWRKLHYASFAVFPAVVAHGVLAGSDSDSVAMRALYVVSGLVVAVLGVARLLRALQGRPNRAQRPPRRLSFPSA